MIPKHLDSVCSKKICRDANCPHAVKEGPTGWFITMGHAGFNSLPNNRNGYRTVGAALSAMRRYLGKGGAPRDAQLTLRIPSPLKESIREIAAAEGRKPADMAVRILQTAVGRGWLKAVALALITLHASAFAESPSMCAAMCKKVNRGTRAQCSIYHIRDYGAILFLKLKKAKAGDDDDDAADTETIQRESLKQCFLATGGKSIEIEKEGFTNYLSCGINTSRRYFGTAYCWAKDKKEYQEMIAAALKGRYLVGAKIVRAK